MPLTKQTNIFDDILFCDPLVSDTACQVRAIYLVYLFHKATGVNQLTVEENLFINDCKLLSENILTEYHPEQADFIVTQRHNDELNFSNTELNQLSKNQKAVSIADKKSKVASAGIQFISQFIKASDDFRSYLSSNFAYISSSKKRISILPCYLNTQLMLRCIEENGFLLIINLKRVHVHDKPKDMITVSSLASSLSSDLSTMEKPQCVEISPRPEELKKIIHSKVICYKYKNNQLSTIETNESMHLEPAVTINMYSSVVFNSRHNYSKIEPVFSCHEFSDFINKFLELNIEKVIMMCAAAHPQLPKSANFSGNDFEPKEHTCENKISDVPFDLQQCSKEQYQLLLHTAKSYGLVNEVTPPGRDDIFNPIRINHIYISNYAKLTSLVSPLTEKNQPALERIAMQNAAQELGGISCKLLNYGLFGSPQATQVKSKTEQAQYHGV